MPYGADENKLLVPQYVCDYAPVADSQFVFFTAGKPFEKMVRILRRFLKFLDYALRCNVVEISELNPCVF